MSEKNSLWLDKWEGVFIMYTRTEEWNTIREGTCSDGGNSQIECLKKKWFGHKEWEPMCYLVDSLIFF